jgi:DNA-binding HxlR family transcriptional regulator
MQPMSHVQPTCLKSKGKRIVNLLGKSHVLEILYLLSSNGKPLRFNEMKTELSITATTLSRRLDDFIEAGFVIREVFAEVPARVEYSLSAKGKSFGPVLRNLFGWVEENSY